MIDTYLPIYMYTASVTNYLLKDNPICLSARMSAFMFVSVYVGDCANNLCACLCVYVHLRHLINHLLHPIEYNYITGDIPKHT